MILITGGAGIIGTRLTQKLLRSGEKVRILALPDDLSAKVLESDTVEVCYGDITDKNSIIHIFKNVKTVYHLAAIILSPEDPSLFEKINIEGTKNCLELTENAGINHFIYVSSASVVYPRPNPYSLSKQKAEELVKASNIPHYTIVRPTLAYEDGGSEELMKFAEYLQKFPIIPFIGNGKALKRPVFVEDLIEGMANIHNNTNSYGKVYNLSGPEILSIEKIAKMLMTHMGNSKPILHFPIFLCRLIGVFNIIFNRLTRMKIQVNWQTISGMIFNADLDNTIAIQDLKFKPRSFSEGIKELKQLKNSLN